MPSIVGGSQTGRQVMADTVRLCHRYTWYAVMMLDHIASEVQRGDHIRARCLWNEDEYPPTFIYQDGMRFQAGRPCLRYYFGSYNKSRMLKLRDWMWNLLRLIERGDYAILIREPDCPCPGAGICIKPSTKTIYYCDDVPPAMTPILLFMSLLHEMYHGVGGKHSDQCDGKIVSEYASGDEGLHELGQKCPDLALINPFNVSKFCQAVGLAVDGNVGTAPCDGYRDPTAKPTPFYWGGKCQHHVPKKPDPRGTLRKNPGPLGRFARAFFGRP